MLNHHRQGSGQPLLLIHGIGSQWQVWKPVLPALAAQRDVIAVDVPGFGGSAPLAPSVAPTIAALTDALAGFLDELGLERVGVAGNSMGAWLALELARRDRARTTVALAPAGFWSPREAVYGRTSLAASRAISRALAPVADRLCATAAGRTALFSQTYARPWQLDPDDAAEALRNFAASPGFDATLSSMASEQFRDGAALACDGTVAWGDRDRLLLPRQARRARRALPRAQHVTLTGCGHVPMGDDPERVARVILDGTAPERG